MSKSKFEIAVANQSEATFSSAKPMEADTISKSGANLKSQMSRVNIIISRRIALIILAITFTSCGEAEVALTEKQKNFCEHYFIAMQTTMTEFLSRPEAPFQKMFGLGIELLDSVKSKGFTSEGVDVLHAFSPTLNEYYFTFIADVLEDLELSNELAISRIGSELNAFPLGPYTMWFIALYSSEVPLQLPQIKSSLIEELDNGNQVWLIEDYQTMKQARLIVQKNGQMNISNYGILF